MITDKTLDEALVEAHRFIKAAKALRAKRKAESHDHLGRRYGNAEAICRRVCSIEHAACKRASLDLTRKLADLRQGR